MIPLIITATMSEPIVYYGDGLHIDGPISYGAYMDLPRAKRETLPPISDPWALDLELPLERWRGPCLVDIGTDPRLTTDGAFIEDAESGYLRAEVWGWKASAAVPVGVPLASIHELRKKIAVQEMGRYTSAKSHHVGTGPMKGKDLRFPKVFVREIRWYAVGDAERIERLLGYVHAIGKLAKQGQGRVESWKVRPIEADLSMFVQSVEGRIPMRRLPSLMVEDRSASIGAIRPPYHHRSRYAWTVEPEAWEATA